MYSDTENTVPRAVPNNIRYRLTHTRREVDEGIRHCYIYYLYWTAIINIISIRWPKE